MQYSVPQFVDVEDKVIGPLTIRQFLWLLGGSGIAILFFVLLPAPAAIVFTIPVALLAAAFAFYKVNGRPFHMYLVSLLGFAIRGKVRVWKREVKIEEDAGVPELKEEGQQMKTKKSLDNVDLAQLVTILDNELSPQARQKPVSSPLEESRNMPQLQNDNIQ